MPLAFSIYIRNFATFFPRILTRQSAGVFRYSSGFTKMHYDLLQRIEHYYKDRKDKKSHVSTNSILAKSSMGYLHVSIF